MLSHQVIIYVQSTEVTEVTFSKLAHVYIRSPELIIHSLTS